MNIFSLFVFARKFISGLAAALVISLFLFPQAWYFLDSLKTDSQRAVASEKIIPYNSVTGESDIEWGKYFSRVSDYILNSDYSGYLGCFLLLFIGVCIIHLSLFFLFCRCNSAVNSAAVASGAAFIPVFVSLLYVSDMHGWFRMFVFSAVFSLAVPFWSARFIPSRLGLQAAYLRFMPYRFKNILFHYLLRSFHAVVIPSCLLTLFFMKNFKQFIK